MAFELKVIEHDDAKQLVYNQSAFHICSVAHTFVEVNNLCSIIQLRSGDNYDSSKGLEFYTL